MIYTDLTKKALRIAFDAHKDQVDKAGLPYVFHPFHLAEQMADEVSVCAALLHDVVEDTPLSFGDLEMLGIPPQIMEVVKILTHESNVPYAEYIQKIKGSGNQAAIAVKLADLRHNSDITRLDSPDERVARLLGRYTAAIEYLSGEQGCPATSCTPQQGNIIEFSLMCESKSLGARYSLVDGERVLCESFHPLYTKELVETKCFTTGAKLSTAVDIDLDITLVPGLILLLGIEEDRSNAYKIVIKVQRDMSVIYTVYGCDGDEDDSGPQSALGPTLFSFRHGAGMIVFYDEGGAAFADISQDIYFTGELPEFVDERYRVRISDEHLDKLTLIFHTFQFRVI